MSENFSAYMAEAIAKAEQRGAERVLRLAEEWSGVSAYDSTRICDEHDCDDSRGRICGADELLQYLKQKLQEPK